MELAYNYAMIERSYEPLDQYVHPNKALLIYGPRRCGKTTLLLSYLSQTSLKTKLISGDDIQVQHILSSQDFREILAFVEGYQLLAIDEAQEIPNIGMGLKILVDHASGLSIIATGSSSFELAGQVGEPLTGRKRTLVLYPIAQAELLTIRNRYELHQELADYLVFGAYPEVILAPKRLDKIAILTEIANSYLLKDILALERIRNSRTVSDLLKMLAFQVGSEVSFNELATNLQVDTKTVQRYLDLLEKAFVIYRLNGFSRNLRQEITNKAKYYFYDNGIRNALVAQFNGLDQRNDLGLLWENFIFMERMKLRTYKQIYANTYFWRTYQGQEIDLVEEREGNLFGFEMKWSVKKATPPPKLWGEAYPNAQYEVITPENYQDFIL
jgi:uncharacterized protein